ncbi:MAG: phosphatase PAP2 family protein [Acidimicrobiales bacterium]
MTEALPAEETLVADPLGDDPVVEASPFRRLRWWKELVAATVFYGVYSFIRNTQGSASVSKNLAFGNARRVIHLEELTGLYHERVIQHAFLRADLLMEMWNVFYGTFHFIITIGVLVILFRQFPDRYRRWRTALAATTALALIGFALYPLMPPRLLPASYGFVDSLKAYGSLWSFDSGAMNRISNQFAAMPSLHFAWSLWCACALVPALRRNWARILLAVYPLITLCAIVITANHYVLDAAGGALALCAGMVYSVVGTDIWTRLHAGRRSPSLVQEAS